MTDSSDAGLATRVIDFLNHELGPGPKITLDSRLAQDLGVAGDDGDDLMENFAKAFDVDLTGRDFLACFGHEGTNPFSAGTFQSPSGNFQVHFYMDPATLEPFYSVDYKAVFSPRIFGP